MELDNILHNRVDHSYWNTDLNLYYSIYIDTVWIYTLYTIVGFWKTTVEIFFITILNNKADLPNDSFPNIGADRLLKQNAMLEVF